MYNCIKRNLIDNRYFYLKLSAILGIILIIINIILIIIAYYICKWLYTKVYNECFLTDCYTNYQKKILKKYGNYTVSKIYLVKYDIVDNCPALLKFILRIYLPNSDNFLEKRNNILNHPSIICELKTNTENKFILIEKNACLRIKTNFNIKENKILKSVELEKKWKFKDILNNTKKRVGKKKYFYWNICENNCQHWIKEILITLGKFDKNNKKFIIQELDEASDIFPRWKLNILTICINLVNLLF